MSDSKTVPSVKPEVRDLFRLRHLLGACLMLIAIWGLALIDSDIGAYAIPAFVITLVALCFPALAARVSRRIWNILGTVVVVVTMLDILLAAGTGRENVIPAVLRAALAIAVLRTLQARNRREEQQHLLLAMFLLAAGGTLSLSPMFAVQVLFFIPIACAILFLTNRIEPRRMDFDRRELWLGFGYGKFLRELARGFTRRTAGFFVALMAGVLLIAALIFMVMPRHRMNNEVPFLALKGAGKTGLSEQVTLGDISEVLQDATVAIRADPPGNQRTTTNPYWRLVALDLYRSEEGSAGFSLSEGVERGFRPSETSRDWTNPVREENDVVASEWQVHMEGNVSRYPALPGPVATLRFDKPESLRFNRSAEMLRLPEPRTTTLHMRVRILGDGRRMEVDERTADTLARLLDSPEMFTPDKYPSTLLAGPDDPASRATLTRIVEEIRKTDTTVDYDPEAFAASASAWLAKHHRYALTDGYARTSARGGESPDYMVRWMDSGATGWCEHFASSFVLLARAAGYPARLVTGFSGGEWNESDQYFVVRMKNAHAWAEIYDGAGAWLRVDPTPGSADSLADNDDDSRVSPRSFSGFDAWYDSLTMLWFRNIVNFEAEDRDEAKRSALADIKSWLSAAGTGLRALKDRLVATVVDGIHDPATLAGGLAALAGLLAGAYGLRRIRRRNLRRRLATASADAPYVRRLREIAGGHLQTLREDRRRGRTIPEATCRELETIRYDVPSRWPDPVATFRTVKAQRRQARRDSR